MITMLLVLHVIVVLLLIGIILIQKSEGGLGLGTGGGSQNMFTARGAANFLTRTTSVLAAIFLANCVLMSTLTNSKLKQSSAFLHQKTKM